MFMRKIVLLAATFMLISTTSLFAFQHSPWTKEIGYNRKIGKKLLYGLTNTSIGFMEVFEETDQAIKEKTPIWLGIGRGILYAVGDTLGGALHALTFPFPFIDIPLPEGGTDVATRTGA